MMPPVFPRERERSEMCKIESPEKNIISFVFSSSLHNEISSAHILAISMSANREVMMSKQVKKNYLDRTSQDKSAYEQHIRHKVPEKESPSPFFGG